MPLNLPEGILAVSRDRELRYWLGRVADGAVKGGAREEKEFDSRLTDVMAAEHDVAPEDAEKGIIVAKYRLAEAGLASGN